MALRTSWLISLAAGTFSTGDRMRFTVESARKKNEVYVVDLLDNTCSCPDWTFRHQNDGSPCKHIMAAKVKLAEQVIDEIKSKLEKRYGNRSRWHEAPL